MKVEKMNIGIKYIFGEFNFINKVFYFNIVIFILGLESI